MALLRTVNIDTTIVTSGCLNIMTLVQIVPFKVPRRVADSSIVGVNSDVTIVVSSAVNSVGGWLMLINIG